MTLQAATRLGVSDMFVIPPAVSGALSWRVGLTLHTTSFHRQTQINPTLSWMYHLSSETTY